MRLSDPPVDPLGTHQVSMANGVVTAEQAAAKAHIDAVNRDYVLQPRLGTYKRSVAVACVRGCKRRTILQITGLSAE